MKIGMIWAQDSNGVIGKENQLPWSLPEDLQHFRKTTTGHPVIMGRKTWQSFPPKYRPLPKRTNIVMSAKHAETNANNYQGAHCVSNLQEALNIAATSFGSEQVWVIGGEQIFSQFLPLAEKIVVTQIKKTFPGDTFAPKLGTAWLLSAADSDKIWRKSVAGLEYRFLVWEQKK